VSNQQPGGQPDEDETLHWGDPSTSDAPVRGHFSRIVVMTRFGITLSIAGVAISCFVLLVYCLVVLAKTIHHAFTETAFDLEGALGIVLVSVSVYTLVHNRAEHERGPK